MFKEVGQVGIRVVIRDEQGVFIASMSQKIAFPYSIAKVEVMVAVRAFKIYQEVRVVSIVLEGDLEVIINSLKDEDDSLAPSGRLIQDMKLIAKTF